MAMKQILYLALIFIFTVSCSAQATKLTERDKLLIVKYVLGNTNFQSDSIDTTDKIIYLSSENLPNSFLLEKGKTFDGMKIEVLNPEEIKKRLIYGFGYNYFEPFIIEGKEVTVIFSLRWRNTTYRTAYKNGAEYKCKKAGKKWKCRVSEIISEQS